MKPLPFHQGQLTLTQKTTVARDTVRLRFAVECEGFSFTAGQFASLQCGPKSWRAYSIASLPTDKELELIVRLIEGGVGSEYLRALQIGASTPFRGGFGHFVLPEDLDERPLVFCATGTGIAPMRGLIQALAATSPDTPAHLWYGGRDADDIAYLDEIATWHPQLQVKLAFSRTDDFGVHAAIAHAGRITQWVTDSHIPTGARFYLCGNGNMVKDMQQRLSDAHIAKEDVVAERFN